MEQIKALDTRYFNSTKNYTLSLLNAFDNIKYYVQEIQENEYIYDKSYKVPITFGNYEKSLMLENVNEKDLTTGNFNFLPRLILSFDSMNRAVDRGTQKFQKFTDYTRTIQDHQLKMSYNSIPYDFNYTMLLQARGMSMATQITEQILSYFNPSMTLNIKEFPLFEKMTETQILIQDPEFEIIEEFEETQVNLINVTFQLTIRGNIYSKIDYQYPIESVHIFTHIWDEFLIQESKLASYYKYDINQDTRLPEKQTERHYNGTLSYDKTVRYPYNDMVQKRPDFSEPEIITDLDEQ